MENLSIQYTVLTVISTKSNMEGDPQQTRETCRFSETNDP